MTEGEKSVDGNSLVALGEATWNVRVETSSVTFTSVIGPTVTFDVVVCITVERSGWLDVLFVVIGGTVDSNFSVVMIIKGGSVVLTPTRISNKAELVAVTVKTNGSLDLPEKKSAIRSY